MYTGLVYLTNVIGIYHYYKMKNEIFIPFITYYFTSNDIKLWLTLEIQKQNVRHHVSYVIHLHHILGKVQFVHGNVAFFH